MPKTVLIVGAGPSGIAAAVEFHRAGWQVRVFERSDRLGGVFSSGWDGLRFVSSSAITDFSTFDHPDFPRERAVFYTAEQYVDYLGAYLRHAGLDEADSIRFCREAVSAELDDDGRIVLGVRNRRTAESESYVGDHLVVSSGLHSRPSGLPAVPGLGSFDGRVLRSTDYRVAADFAGQRVVVVGGGESASDIADLVSREAKQVFLSMRRGPGVVIARQDRTGSANDIYTGRAYYATRYHHRLGEWHRLGADRLLGLVRPDAEAALPRDEQVARAWAQRINSESGMLRSPYRRFGTKTLGLGRAIARGAAEKPAIASVDGGVVRFTDGTSAECDAIIFAVGFPAPRFSALAGLPDFDLTSLYKRLVPIGSPWTGRLSLIGFARPTVGAIPPIAELQSRLAVAIADEVHRLPSADEMRADVERFNAVLTRQFPLDFPQRSALVDFIGYMVELAETIGCEPDLRRLFLEDRPLWYRVVYGPMHGAQFRLDGDPAEARAARARLMALPCMPAYQAAWASFGMLAGKALDRLRPGRPRGSVGI